MKQCLVVECGKKNHAKGYCALHYARLPENRKRADELRRVRNKKTNYAIYKKYEKTPKGFLMRTFRNMQSRVKGIQKKKAHLYFGKEILQKKAFYSWSLSDHKFLHLFSMWQKSGYKRALTPSIDRIDPSQGYLLENMRWLTHSENSRNASLRRHALKSPKIAPGAFAF